MPRYYGTVTITLVGEFEADGIEEIENDPMMYVCNASIYNEIEELEEIEEPDGDEWEE